jgi:Asp-tRNA(Asn)/Glu-tRNA(Gln) amidotransferase A subunit family amidase
MHQLTIAELIRGLRRKDFSSTELTRHYLDRIARLDKTYNSYITVTEELALQQAAAADQRLAAGDAPALCGVPIAHKDIFCTQGVRTSCASKMLDNFIAPYNATIVENYLRAGVVTLGKTNMDEFAMGSSNETSWYGPVKNPWATGSGRHCFGYRRLHSPAGCPLRPHRHQAHLWTCVPLGHDCLCFQSRPGRCADPHRRGCGHPAE